VRYGVVVREHVTFVGVQAIPAVEQCASALASVRVQTWQAFVHSRHDAFFAP
jgi:hypothetical protein